MVQKVMYLSQAARELGCSEKWLRHTETTGKIPQARRDLNGWRVYTEEDIEELKRLRAPAREHEDDDIDYELEAKMDELKEKFGIK